MKRSRICGKQCHAAKSTATTCRCWCNGLFHGSSGQVSRAEFMRDLILEKMPTTEEMFRNLTERRLFNSAEAWRDRVDAAVAARKEA